MVKQLFPIFKLLMTNLINPISCCAAQGAKASTAYIYGTAAPLLLMARFWIHLICSDVAHAAKSITVDINS
jgi:hypothetical protein